MLSLTFIRQRLLEAGLARTLLLAILMVFSLGNASAAQGATVSGVVLSPDSSVVAGANLQLDPSNRSATTNRQGRFVFANVPAGEYRLTISAIGYVPVSRSLSVASDSGWAGQILVTRQPQPLPPIAVQAVRPSEWAHTSRYDDFFRRRAMGQGVFRSRADLLRMGASDIASSLQQIPGVTVSATPNPYGELEYRFRIARCPGQPPRLAVFIDGIKAATFGESTENRGSELTGVSGTPRRVPRESSCEDCVRLAEILSSFPATSIEFIEFYRGPGQIPSDVDRGDACAALLIWTR